MSDRTFGVSTHLFHESRLSRDHLVEIAAHEFEAIELFATRSHFDYTDIRAHHDLADWLSDTRLTLHSVHAPIFDALRDGQWIGAYSIACADEARRRGAVEEARAALQVARSAAVRFLVVHLGIPAGETIPGGDNQGGAARRSLEEISSLAADAGVRVAVEVIPNDLSSPAALVQLLEEELDLPDVGICLDYGHAHLTGDVADAIEMISGHLVTTHVHDNGGRHDDHLVPFGGLIDWDTAMMATQKIGYDGPLMFEVADTGDAQAVLRKAVKARERLEKMFVMF